VPSSAGIAFAATTLHSVRQPSASPAPALCSAESKVRWPNTALNAAHILLSWHKRGSSKKPLCVP